MTQGALYLFVGGFATAVDLWVYNVLAGPRVQMGRIPAHVISTMCAMAVGFTLHLLLVFRPSEALFAERIPKYVLTVCCSAYGLQTFLIYWLSFVWTRPAEAAGSVGFEIGIKTPKGRRAVERIFVKLCAICCGLVFNFVSFKFFVYAD